MKNVLLNVFVLLLAFTVSSDLGAQIRTPAPSPGATVKQTVGLVDVTVDYSRPSVKGRTIFGDLVPYDQPWRLGANQATKISFSGDVMLGGKAIKAGDYAVLAKPGRSSWSYMFYPHTTGDFSAYLEDGVKAAATVMAQPVSMGEITVENFMIQFDQITNSSANMWVIWDKTAVPVEIKVETEKAVQASIDRTMAGPGAGDYFAAASYYLSEDKELDKALTWINKSVEMGNDQFWVLRAKSLIQSKLGDKAGAIATAKKSLEKAKEAGNNDYVKMNEESIKGWMM
ncbi:MAG: DUF2911 domain-containing protein [Saprospiraceae bacterium]|nr:DUF2911 domain-containing protein [Saprospiraceae bacterium]